MTGTKAKGNFNLAAKYMWVKKNEKRKKKKCGFHLVIE